MASKREESPADDTPVWMVTFSDLTTLLLTFFVLLVSMAYFDESLKKETLVTSQKASSIGSSKFSFNPLARSSAPSWAQPGPMDTTAQNIMEPLHEALLENEDEDIKMESNRYISIISVNENVLFQPGDYRLSSKGKLFLNRLIPALRKLKFPLLIAGHSSVQRDEMPVGYKPFQDEGFSPSWKLSLLRSLSIYEYFINNGISSEQLTNEAFGEYRPKVSNNTPQGRKTNRRVDLVLDKRNPKVFIPIKEQQEPKKDNVYQVNEFRFKLDIPPSLGTKNP